LAGGLLLILLVSACSTTQITPSDQDARNSLYQARFNEVSSRVNWELDGRLAVNDGSDGGSGNFNWVRQNESSHMNFHGALGRGAWRLDAEPGSATLELADGEIYRAGNVTELVRDRLRWQIPVDALEWWVRGLEAPGGTPNRQLDEQGLLVKLNQFGWNIEYDRYLDSDVVVMPHKMTARREKQTVKLAVRRWFLSASGNEEK
jgi:outer membrane lipoprotein LolB